MKTLFVGLLAASITATVYADILTGPITNAANGHVYYLLSYGTWNAAQADATRLGGNLVTINDAAEQDWVFTTFSATGGTLRGLWIGLTDFGHEGNFTWISGESVAYRNWAPGEPNNGGPTSDESFVHMWPLGNSGGIAAGTWNDLPGVTEYGNVILHGVVEVDPTLRPANLLGNGSFENPLFKIFGNYVIQADALSSWETDAAQLLVWVPDLPSEFAADGWQHLELPGNGNSIWQTVTTTTGQDYRLAFAHSARPSVNSLLKVELDGQVIATLPENGLGMTGFSWRMYATNFVASSNRTVIKFYDASATSGACHVDNVALVPLPLNSTLRVSEVEFCWPSVASKTYQVQYRSTLTGNLWTDLLAPIPGNGQTNCIKDPVPIGEPRRFYRVIIP